jgi:hypothetical protein
MGELLVRERPVLAVLWHQFNGLHYALDVSCRRAKVPVTYAEYGLLPGTIMFDAAGLMAESTVARDAESFARVPVTSAQIDAAQDYCLRVREKRWTRKPQLDQPGVTARLEQMRAAQRPVVFYAGENIARTGILPAGTERSRMHSPFFAGTSEALAALCTLAVRRDWHVVYKPHPLAIEIPLPDTDEAHFTVARDADIFELMALSDVTATLVSQVCYMAVLSDRPCLLMGRGAMSGSGCAYELTVAEDLEAVLEDAIDGGFTAEQRDARDRHVAQLLTAYLYSLDPEVEETFDRGPEVLASVLCDEALAAPPSLKAATLSPYSHRSIMEDMAYLVSRVASVPAGWAAAMLPNRAKSVVTKRRWF